LKNGVGRLLLRQIMHQPSLSDTIKRAESVHHDRLSSHHPIIFMECQMATSKSTASNPRGNYRIVTHGSCRNRQMTPEYACWSQMKRRCYNPNHPEFKHYGLRGIRVCDRWLESFENFLEDMGLKPFPEASIGRANNDGNYEKSNCSWETYEQQASNKRTSRYLTHDGITLTLTRWAKRVGMNRNTLTKRLRSGWSVKKALTTKDSTRVTMLNHDGISLSERGWAKKLGISHGGIRYRLNQGWSIGQIVEHYGH